MKKYIICDATNPAAFSAIKDVLTKIPGEFYFTPIVCEDCKSLQKININDGIDRTGETVEFLFESFKKTSSDVLVYVIDIKESITFERSEKNPKFCCTASLMSEDFSKIMTAFITLDLPENLQEHLCSRKNIYQAINLCYEEKIEEGACLYNYFFKKEKTELYKETLLKMFFV
jgi:hypothetical protein